mmetsp:Transcript_38826/g.82721  ORF Transcript_38826/g.82721 Transcript_38826/m.82721 type:complete len:339 (-) Transcript_38826:127-1143(-)
MLNSSCPTSTRTHVPVALNTKHTSGMQVLQRTATSLSLALPAPFRLCALSLRYIVVKWLLPTTQLHWLPRRHLLQLLPDRLVLALSCECRSLRLPRLCLDRLTRTRRFLLRCARLSDEAFVSCCPSLRPLLQRLREPYAIESRGGLWQDLVVTLNLGTARDCPRVMNVVCAAMLVDELEPQCAQCLQLRRLCRLVTSDFTTFQPTRGPTARYDNLHFVEVGGRIAVVEPDLTEDKGQRLDETRLFLHLHEPQIRCLGKLRLIERFCGWSLPRVAEGAVELETCPLHRQLRRAEAKARAAHRRVGWSEWRHRRYCRAGRDCDENDTGEPTEQQEARRHN